MDLETGIMAKTMGPEVPTQALYRDRFIGVVRTGHKLSKSKINTVRYVTDNHVTIWRKGIDRGPVDEALELLELKRNIVTMVGEFSAVLVLARASDLIASVPGRTTRTLCVGMHTFPLPVLLPEITVSLLWHPRMDADPAHRWLRRMPARGLHRATCRLINIQNNQIFYRQNKTPPKMTGLVSEVKTQ